MKHIISSNKMMATYQNDYFKMVHKLKRTFKDWI